MKKITWKMAFGLSITIHLLLAIVLCSSAWDQSEQSKVKEKQKQPIEVELAAYSEISEAADTTKPENKAAFQNGQSYFNEKNKNINQSNKGVTKASSSANSSSGATADSGTGISASQGNASIYSGGGSPGGGSSLGSSPSRKSTGNGSGKTAKVAVIYAPPPVYPNEARKEHWEGTVQVKVLVSEEGVVTQAVVVGPSGYSSIDEAALTGVRRWRFSPKYVNGEAVPVWVVVPVGFELE